MVASQQHTHSLPILPHIHPSTDLFEPGCFWPSPSRIYLPDIWDQGLTPTSSAASSLGSNWQKICSRSLRITLASTFSLPLQPEVVGLSSCRGHLLGQAPASPHSCPPGPTRAQHGGQGSPPSTAQGRPGPLILSQSTRAHEWLCWASSPRHPCTTQDSGGPQAGATQPHGRMHMHHPLAPPPHCPPAKS